MGIHPFRLYQHMLIESVLLALLAGAFVGILAYWTNDLLFAFAPSPNIPTRTDQGWNWLVFANALLLALATGAIPGLVPAWNAFRIDMFIALKNRGAGTMVLPVTASAVP